MTTSFAGLTTIVVVNVSIYLTQSQCCQEFIRDLYWAPYFNRYSSVNLFADDFLLYHQITDAMDYSLLQEEITLLEDWSVTNHLNFNVAKCKYMIISK